MSIWFTADTHFGHKGIIKWCGRPFDTLEEMDSILISNWNSMVKEVDVVYHLGDFAFGKQKKYLKKLNGRVILIKGNHDKGIDKLVGKYGLMEVCDVKYIVYKSAQIYMSHYSHRVWRNSCHGSFNLYGHSHGKLPFFRNSWDVGVDNNNFYPISFYLLRRKIITENHYLK